MLGSKSTLYVIFFLTSVNLFVSVFLNCLYFELIGFQSLLVVLVFALCDRRSLKVQDALTLKENRLLRRKWRSRRLVRLL